MKEITLDQLPKGHFGIITAIKGDGMLRGRLLDLGLVPQTSVCLMKLAPFGDPIQIMLRGYMLTIRRKEAKLIIIRPVDTTKE